MEPEVKNCACGKDHMFMPTDQDFSCNCVMFSWLDPSEWKVTPGCTHPMFTYELVCREHKRHIPCRECP